MSEQSHKTAPVATHSQRKPREKPANARERFVAHHVRRTINLRRALRNFTRMANRKVYEGTPEEIETILRIIRDDVSAMERAYKGQSKERGLYDL